MKILIKSYILLLSITIIACSDKWNDHIGTISTQENLYEVIRADANYSAFADLLDESGYATDLQASKNYTVIVPTNAAVEAIRSQYDFTDSTVLRTFVGYHIMNSIYNANESADTIRVLNFRNKYVDFLDGKFNEINPAQVNHVASNGVFHTVNTALTPLGNILEFVHFQYPDLHQVQAIRSFDTLKIVEGQELVYFSTVWNTEARRPMRTESEKYTYFVVDDEFYDGEYSKLAPYFTTSYAADGPRPDSTTVFFTQKAILRDYIVGGEFNRANLPAEMLSLNGATFSVSDADIIASYKVSNGIVHRVKKIDIAKTEQVKEFKVLGNMPAGFRQSSDRIFYRTKRDQNGEIYEDIQIQGHNVTAFYAKYRKQSTNAVRYRVYGRAIAGLIGDPQTTPFTQYVAFLNPASTSLIEADRYNLSVINASEVAATRMTFDVAVLNHNEVYLGEVNHNEFGALNLLVMSNAQGPIILEYLRFVPIL